MTVTSITKSKIYGHNFPLNFEFPPPVIQHGADYRYFISNAASLYYQDHYNLSTGPLDWYYSESNPKSITHTPEQCKWDDFTQLVDPNYITGEQWNPPNDTLSQLSDNPPGIDYRRRYTSNPGYLTFPFPYARQWNGAAGAHVILSQKTSSELLLTINHGENGNLKRGSYYYDNTFHPYWLPNDEEKYYAVQTTRFLTSYGAFVTASWQHYDQDHRYGMSELPYTSLGPIAWPSHGYMSDLPYPNSHIGHGLRHPSSIQTWSSTNGFLYVFFTDTSAHTKDDDPAQIIPNVDQGNKGLWYGVKCVRVPIVEADNPPSFRVWRNGNWNNPSIPAGLDPYTIWDNDKDVMNRDYLIQGIESDAVVGDNSTMRFSAAALLGSDNQYLGVEERNTVIYKHVNDPIKRIRILYDNPNLPLDEDGYTQTDWIGTDADYDEIFSGAPDYKPFHISSAILLWRCSGLENQNWELLGMLSGKVGPFDEQELVFPIFLNAQGTSNNFLYTNSNGNYEVTILGTNPQEPDPYKNLSKYSFEYSL